MSNGSERIPETSDAEVLREAARLMRERAKGATPGPWDPTTDNWVRAGYGSPLDGENVADAVLNSVDAAHIASWHPDVALAVADWLDGAAGATSLQFGYAVAVARAYLGAER